jgi:hypothetical protein
MRKLKTEEIVMSNLSENLKILDDHSKELQEHILRKPNGILKYPYVTAGHKVYQSLIDWDTVWGGMSYLIDGDTDPLRYSLLNMLEHITPDGKGHRNISHDGYKHAIFTKRPFVATGAFILTRELDSADWLPLHLWKNLRNYLFYFHNHRTGRHGLAKWLMVGEGFADNGLANASMEMNSVEAVDLNAQLVLEHTAAAYIAEKLNQLDEAEEHYRYAESLQQRLNHVLWDEEDGYYYSMYNPPLAKYEAEQIRNIHYTNLWPLWLGLAPAERAKRIIDDYILNEEHFWSDYGIRSMSKSDRRYNNAKMGTALRPDASGPYGICSNWQGPIWSLTNYLMAIALKRYGYEKEAMQVTEKIVSVLANEVKEKGHFYENYSAETGEGLSNGGIASWCLMIRFLPEHISTDTIWMLKGLKLPGGNVN